VNARVTLEEAQVNLPQLLAQLQSGQEMAITLHGEQIAVVKKTARTARPCKAGGYRKPGFWMAPDFDAPLEEFREYME
jgi:antitoxin (DNA-binding transcriptional repressor) of toxin-antitoxin stability system